MPKTVNFSCPLVANQQSIWMAFSFLPLHRADLYNIAFTNQNLIGTETTADFSITRFNIQQNKNGIMIYSSDKDIVSWFQSGKIYIFIGTATLK